MIAASSNFRRLRLNGVSRNFGSLNALRDVTLEVGRGEFIALLGPSGCGKSTALNCLAGLLPLTGGSIWLDQKRVDTLPPEKRGFGMVFQNYALFPHMSVRRNVGFGLKMRGIGGKEAWRRVDEALRLVQLQPYADRLPGQLSGGQQQRVAIARAIVIEPPLVLMDEPLSNLDAALRLDMRTEIRRLHQSLGLTTVYVTHDQEEALSLADRLVVLREGLVQQVGTPEELYRSPANPYVAGFMGYRNLLPMTATARTGNEVTVSGYGIALTGQARNEFGTGPVTVAIRPEDFTVAVEPPDPRNHLRVAIEVVEYHGREQAIQARLPEGEPLRIRSSTTVARGDVVPVWVPEEYVLVFGEQLDGPPVEVAAGPSTGAATNPVGAAS